MFFGKKYDVDIVAVVCHSLRKNMLMKKVYNVTNTTLSAQIGFKLKPEERPSRMIAF